MESKVLFISSSLKEMDRVDLLDGDGSVVYLCVGGGYSCTYFSIVRFL